MSRKLPEGEGKRIPLNMRSTRELRDRLEAEAQKSGRSLAQEVEFRLQQSFRESDLVEVLVGGKRTKSALHIITSIFRMAKTPDGKTWEDDAGVANAVGIAVNRLITQITGDCREATDLLRAQPERERSITYAGQLIANYAILSHKAEFDAEVMVGREGAITPPQAIERFVVNREKV